MGIGQQIEKGASKAANKVIKPVKKDLGKMVKEVTKIQKMLSCPVSITSNFPLCATSYLFDLLGYCIMGFVFMLRLPFVLVINWIIWCINWVFVPVISYVSGTMAYIFHRPDLKWKGKAAIPYFNIWISHKNDVVRIVEYFMPFPVFDRTKVMKKCYCASSVRWVFQPLQMDNVSWSKRMREIFDPVLNPVMWMFSMYKEAFAQKQTTNSSIMTTYVAGGLICLFTGLFYIDGELNK